MALSENIINEIKTIPGEEGFWSSGSEETFLEVGQKLVNKGISEDETLEILSTLYFATANCYGD